MTPAEIQRALRLITSPEWKRSKRFPITVLAAMSGLSRDAIYKARAGKLLTSRIVDVLSPLLEDIITNRMSATRQSGYAVDRRCVDNPRREERRFFHGDRATVRP